MAALRDLNILASRECLNNPMSPSLSSAMVDIDAEKLEIFLGDIRDYQVEGTCCL